MPEILTHFDRKNLFDTLKRIHAAGINHGDFEARNVVLGCRGPIIVDFSHASYHQCPGLGACEEVLKAFQQLSEADSTPALSLFDQPHTCQVQQRETSRPRFSSLLGQMGQWHKYGLDSNCPTTSGEHRQAPMALSLCEIKRHPHGAHTNNCIGRWLLALALLILGLAVAFDVLLTAPKYTQLFRLQDPYHS